MSGSSVLRGGYGLADDDDVQQEMDDERLQDQKDMQMLDLGTGRREYVTTVDKPLPRELRQSKEQLLRARKVNEEGTDAAKWYQQNKTALNAWNNIGADLADDHADREKLDELMGGQSHRARLNKEIREQGGQEYGEVSTVKDDYPRRARGSGGVNRGIAGRSARGAPMRVPVSRAAATVISPARNSIPTAPRASRPLDPAIDPDREYGYKSKRGGKTFTMSYSGGGPVRVNPTLGRGKTPNDARATMEGSTVRIRPASSTKTKSDASETSRAPRPAPVTVALHDEAFLKVMNSMTSKSAFNDHIQDKSKPAPASKAAALFEQPVKATKKPSIGTKKPARDINRSPATPADAYRKMQERAVGNIPERKGENIRLAPRHDFGSPSPVTRAGGNRLQHDNASIHTDGMETAATFDSGDIGTQDSGDAGIKTSHGSTSTQEDSAAKVQEQHNSNGLGVTVPPPVGQVDHEDLILLDQGVEQTQAPANISDTGPGGPSKINSGPSSDVPHIMDEDLDVELPPPTLTPKSHVAPRTLTFRGARYLREDTVPPFARPENQMNPFGGMYNRVALTEGVNIGLRTLQENSTGSILGEQNLPGQARRGSGASSIAGLATSRWGIKNVKSGIPETNLLDQSMFKTSAIPRTFSPIWEHDKYSSRKAETSDAPKTDIPAAPPATQERAPALNPGSSKYATQDRIVATSHKLSVEPEKRPHSAEPSAVESVRKDSSPSITSPRDREDKIVTTSKVANNHQSMYFNPSLKTDDLPFDRLSQNAANSTLVAPKPVRKTANLAASKWGSPDAKIITSTLAKMVGDKIPSSKSTENGGKNLGSAPMSKQGELRKRNPFESDTQPAPQISAVVDRHLVPTEAAQAERVPGMVRQFGNNQAENHAPRTIDERRIRFMGSALPVVGSDSRASPSMSETSAAASIEPAKPLVESRWANNGVENKSNGSRSSQTKTKPVANLMASKYAASTSSFSSFRKVRQIKDDSSSDESEI